MPRENRCLERIDAKREYKVDRSVTNSVNPVIIVMLT